MPLKAQAARIRAGDVSAQAGASWDQFVDVFDNRTRQLRDDAFATNPTGTGWGDIMDNTYDWSKALQQPTSSLSNDLMTFAFVHDYSLNDLVDAMVT
jgi:hypothetical protein